MSPWILWLCLVVLSSSGLASDVPFVFNEDSFDFATYSSAQLEEASSSSPDLVGVPLATSPSDNEILKIPYAGDNAISGNKSPIKSRDSIPKYELEKEVIDIKDSLNRMVEPGNPLIRETAEILASSHPGDLRFEQIYDIYNYLKYGDGTKNGWSYVRDPRGIDSWNYANESLRKGEKGNCVGVGDCDDFAILMASFIESIGGTTRIILANNSVGGHAYTEVYLGRLDDPSQIDAIVEWLIQESGAGKVYCHIDTDTKEAWLNLDWGLDEKGNAYPGGPFFQGDKHYVLRIRDTYGRIPLGMPETSNKAPRLVSLSPDKNSPQEAGSIVNWTAKATDRDDDHIFYRFFLDGDSVTRWTENNSWIWKTNDADIGPNQVEVHVRDGKHAGPNRFDSNKAYTFSIAESRVASSQEIRSINNSLLETNITDVQFAPATPANLALRESMQNLPSRIYLGSGQDVAYTQYQSAMASFRGNELWIQNGANWSQYVIVPAGSEIQFIAFAPSGGQVDYYEILQTDSLNIASKHLNFFTGYNSFDFRADEVGRHVLLFVLNNQPSNAIIIDVISQSTSIPSSASTSAQYQSAAKSTKYQTSRAAYDTTGSWFGPEFENVSSATNFVSEFYMETSSGFAPVKIDVTKKMPSRIYLGSGQDVAYTQYQSAMASFRGNELWIQNGANWSQYVIVPAGSEIQFIAFAPSGGQVDYYEILQTDSLNIASKHLNFFTGYNSFDFRADEVGRHVLLFVLNNQPSNAIIIDVISQSTSIPSSATSTQHPSAAASTQYQTSGAAYATQTAAQTAMVAGDTPVTIQTTMRGYDVYVDGALIGKDGANVDALDGVFRFNVVGGQTHTIRIFDGENNYEKPMYFERGVLKVINVPAATTVYTTGMLAGDTPVTIQSAMRGYDVYLDGAMIGKDGANGDALDGVFRFNVVGGQTHTIRIFDGQNNYEKPMYFDRGVSKVINVPAATTVYVTGMPY